MSDPDPREHYSYSVYANPDIAQRFDERRFGGPIGQLIASEQGRVLSQFVGRIADRTILDVGTGTGRAALLMARGGADVTGVDASEEMLTIARERAAEESLPIRFETGDVLGLRFSDRSFEVVICLRVLMHAADWRQGLAELCRVSNGLVIFDYPSDRSFASLQAKMRSITHRMGVETEPYRVLADRVVADELTKAGFAVQGIHRQFVLPIALHKRIGSRRFSQLSRNVSERLGLLQRFGSPVTLVAQRWTS